jgi:predicted DNA-binding transcriptional regulator YafY
MPRHPLTTRLRRRKTTGGIGSPLLRQWNLLALLSADSEPATVYELADRLGVSVKTIRRDLVLFKQLGFDIDVTQNEFGLQYWRIRSRFDMLRGKQRQYRSLADSVAVLVGQAQTIGDAGLAADLEAIRRKVQRKAR